MRKIFSIKNVFYVHVKLYSERVFNFLTDLPNTILVHLTIQYFGRVSSNKNDSVSGEQKKYKIRQHEYRYW